MSSDEIQVSSDGKAWSVVSAFSLSAETAKFIRPHKGARILAKVAADKWKARYQ